ncbi:DUF2267 domain-containing protein [Streptomyces sp. SL13]|uniref:DUF2267 domain-containing protein n=1 Tax=Streptantibioticus silvisoli TaxID=2705255 RepID=A0AA90JW00_9ACTN|nr:DUF2267 domain-containing protein [Streptantibioticus silvisoli]MDI5962765.1 DUF2267 domain-containing protein [Streptantibioticus silvisoli]MDI5968366.1 DUF2267 domain-containing protein [Streptantibioticus silvisoli]
MSLHTIRSAPGMAYGQLLERVRYDGAYPTRERAERAVRDVLGALGRQLTGEERAALAARLPAEAAFALNAQASDTAPAAEALTGWGFVKELAARTGGTPATTRWDTGAVLSTVAHLAGEDFVARVIARLPPGYALLFGRIELSRAEAA